MREAILIHMGQAGAQIGNACWESLLASMFRGKFSELLNGSFGRVAESA